jgi:hypothetical protein
MERRPLFRAQEGSTPSDPDAYVPEVMSLYGATMLQIQCLENAVSLLYALVNADPEKRSNASVQRQWREAFTMTWNAFQKGSPGMKLNDATRGLKGKIPDELHSDLDLFFRRQRNQLAHRFLIERMRPSPEGGARFARGSTLELLETTIKARKLLERVTAHADALREKWPTHPDPPENVLEVIEQLARAAQFKQRPTRPRPETSARQVEPKADLLDPSE